MNWIADVRSGGSARCLPSTNFSLEGSMNHPTRTPLAQACVVALGCALGAPGSQAATANASLSNFEIIATDLDLNDGIEAGFSFPDSNETILQVLGGRIPGLPFLFDEAQNFRDSSATLQLRREAGGAIADARAGASFVSASAAAPDGSGLSVQTVAFREAPAIFPFGAPGLSIQPNTRVTFTADVSLSYELQPDCGSPCTGLASVTGVSFQLLGLRPGGVVDAEVFALFELLPDVSSPLSDSKTEQMSVSFSTASDPFSGAVQFDARSFVTTIPEPETYALMMLGLGMLGAVCRKRRGADRSEP